MMDLVLDAQPNSENSTQASVKASILQSTVIGDALDLIEEDFN